MIFHTIRKAAIIMAALCIFLPLGVSAQALYLDESAPIDARVKDLLSQMTPEEKISMLTATSFGVPRLGVSKYFMGNEALHGVLRPGHFTVFPQAIGLASMWNPTLHRQIASVISDEARARWNELGQGELQQESFSDLLTFWSPTINMARDPRWGRTPETYGEDPYLSAVLGTEFVRGLQGDDPRYLKVASTPKHFAVNNEEHNRFECDARVPEKILREYYFPAFEMCVRDGHCRSIMSAYNAINGVPCTANPWLLTKVLRNDWGFDGYVVSDCGAPSMLWWAHHYVKTKETAGTLALKAGLDVECGDDVYREPLVNAWKQYMVSEEDIDSAAYHILKVRMELGMFDNPANNPYSRISPDVIGCDAHRDLSLEAARQSIVLLKNKNNMLPLNPKKLKKVAVVGINADRPEFGDYSGTSVTNPVSTLRGIRERLGDSVEVLYAPWKSAADGMEIIGPANFPDGLKAEYFTNCELGGEPSVRTEEWINFEPANQAPDPFIPQTNFSIRWSGRLRPDVSGNYTFSLTSDQGARMKLDGKTLIDAWWGHAMQSDTVSVYLEADRDYDLVTEYYDTRDCSVARLQWKVPETDKATRLELFGKAGETVRQADVVIAVLGSNKSIEREGSDREHINLQPDQQEFLEEIYKVNKNVVLVLVAGSPLSINWADENIDAIVNAWYPGECGGTAVAEVLFGDYNPAGRLPVTFYRKAEDLPAFDDYDIRNGRTYQYFTGDVLYPFGYGLSYTKFEYSDLVLEDGGDVINVSFNLRNSGKRAGDEVAQVYVRLPERDEVMPIKELKGFSRESLAKGEKRRVTIPVRKDLLRYWDESDDRFVTPSGSYTIMVGRSSADIVLTDEIDIKI